MNDIEKIKELTTELLRYCHEYYDLDQPTISDKEYDTKYEELFKLENEANFWLANSPTRKVQGSVLEGFAKVEHTKPMLSAAKTKDINEIKKFLGYNPFYCSYKLDGLTLVVRYSHGKFVQAITRGTGIIGEDVTEQAKMISNLPMNIPYTYDLELRGECVISWDNFNKINETLENKYSHPRNLAAGSLRNLDTRITKVRNLSYVVFECVSDLYDEDEKYDSKWDELGYLDYLGFETVYRCLGEVEDCAEVMTPESYSYPVDGLIFEMYMKEYSKSLGSTSHHESCRMALKWADDTYETTLRDIEFTMGKSGTLTPTAIFEPVEIDGTIVERASLHNISILEEIFGSTPHVGQKITVYKANQIIPQVLSADKNTNYNNVIFIPLLCPVCGGKTEIKQDNDSKVLICTNDNCKGKLLGKLTHFVSKNAMNIDGLSEATLEKFIELGWLNDFIDIYNLKEHKSEMMNLEGFGKKSVEKLLNAIEKSRNTTLDRFIYSLCIPLIGKSASKTISKYFNGKFNSFFEIIMEEPFFDWTELEDFGSAMEISLCDYFDKWCEKINELANMMTFDIPQVVNVSNINLSGKTFVITGSLNHFENRDVAKEKIESLGGKVSGSVSAKTTYLVNNDIGSMSGKNKKAKELGVKIITEAELLDMINN
jgi:DNA ligase (NAD+)